MALGTGIYGAYRGVQPIAEDFGALLAEDENARFRYRQEQREQQAINDKKAKDLRDRILSAQQGLNVDASGFSAYDEQIANVVLKAADEIDKAYEVLRVDPNNLEASKTLQQAEMLPAMLKQSITKYQNDLMNYGKGLQDGTYSEYLNKDWQNASNAIFDGRMRLDFKPGTGLVAQYDQDGDGMVDLGFGGIKGGIDLGRFKERFDALGFKEQVKDSYGYETIQTPNGMITTRVKDISPKSKRSIRENIDDAFGMTAETMTDDARSYLYDELKLDPNKQLTDTEFDAIKTSFYLENVEQFDREDIKTKKYFAPTRPSGRGRTEQDDKNWYRTTVDGVLMGDQKSQGALIGGKDQYGTVAEVYDTGDTITIEYVDKDGNPADVRELDKNDPRSKGVIGRILKPKFSPDQVNKYYEEGVLMDENFEFAPPVTFNISRALVEFDELAEKWKDDGLWTGPETTEIGQLVESYLGNLNYAVDVNTSGTTDTITITPPNSNDFVVFDLDENGLAELRRYLKDAAQPEIAGQEGSAEQQLLDANPGTTTEQTDTWQPKDSQGRYAPPPKK